MALNPFEQLQNVQSEPRQAFEDITSTILRATVAGSRRVRVYRGDGGVDVYDGTFGRRGKVDVYQIKYFPDPWSPAQKGQIRKSYNTAFNSSEFGLRRWILCIPTRLRKEDIHWFDEWRGKQAVPIELMDGDDLTTRLQRSECAAALQQLVEWGVQGLTPRGVRFAARGLVRKTVPGRITFAIDLSITNTGVRTARDLRVIVQHTENHCAGISHDPQLWEEIAVGELGLRPVNPRHLAARRDLNPQGKVSVLQILISTDTVFPFKILIHLSVQDQQPTTLAGILTSTQAEAREEIKFAESQDTKIDGKPVAWA